jgi:DNA-binding response OmpR family regulator
MRARILTYLIRPGVPARLRERRQADRRTDDRRNNERRVSDRTGSPSRDPVLSLDSARQCALIGEQMIPLTSREFSLLSKLSAAPNGSCTAEEIRRDLWQNSESSSNVIQVTVGRLRKKVGADCIKTQRGSGYRLGMRVNYLPRGG